jgi:hypothetical protein
MQLRLAFQLYEYNCKSAKLAISASGFYQFAGLLLLWQLLLFRLYLVVDDGLADAHSWLNPNH